MNGRDKDTEVGATVREYSELHKTAACLARRLKRFRDHLDIVVENPARADELEHVTKTDDPREDAKALVETRAKIRECEDFLRKQGLTNIFD